MLYHDLLSDWPRSIGRSNPEVVGSTRISLVCWDSQISFNRVIIQGDLMYRQYCLFPIPKHLFEGNSFVLHCASLLRTIFESLPRVYVQNVRDFPQTKHDSEINSPFLSNERGDPRFLFSGIC